MELLQTTYEQKCVSWILGTVEDEFKRHRIGVEASEYCIFIFYRVKEADFLFHDTFITSGTINELQEQKKIIYKGVIFHQGCLCLKYQFIGYKYPEKYNRAPSPKLRRLILDRDEHRCVNCQRDYNLVIDHIYPWAEGGRTNEVNLQTLCNKCNSIKSKRTDLNY